MRDEQEKERDAPHFMRTYPPEQPAARHAGEQCKCTVTPFDEDPCPARRVCLVAVEGINGLSTPRAVCPWHRDRTIQMAAKFYPNARVVVVTFARTE